jgi:DHA2 family methylenomycin A resistance protein-like MFS transporter
LAGQTAAVVTLAAFSGATIEAGPHGFTSTAVLVAYGVAVLSLTTFLWVEARTRQPMLPLPLFRRPDFAGPTTIGLLANVCFYGLIFLFSLFFQVQHGYSALQAGLAFLPMTVAIMGANFLAGKVASVLGTARTIVIGLTAMAIACVALIGTGRSTPYGEIVVQQILLGAGLGLLVPPMTASLLGSVDRACSGVAAGTLNAMRQTGSLLGIALFGSLIVGPGGFFEGMRSALAISLGVLALGALLAIQLGRHHPTPMRSAARAVHPAWRPSRQPDASPSCAAADSSAVAAHIGRGHL